MIADDILIITNNPLTKACMGGHFTVELMDGDYRDVLIRARDMVYAGHELYTHPLAGSVKPKETIYRSIALSKAPRAFDGEQAEMIGNAILTFDKFPERNRVLSDKLKADFQLIDYTLIASALDFDAVAGLNNIN